MMGWFGSDFRQFLRDEGGTASVEFVLVFPIYLSLMAMSIELSLITLRHTLLERGLDIAVREIRLGTGTAPAHDDIKELVCANSIMLLDCETKLRLEMRSADIRAFNSLDTSPDEIWSLAQWPDCIGDDCRSVGNRPHRLLDPIFDDV